MRNNKNIITYLLIAIVLLFAFKKKKPAQIIFEEDGNFDFPDDDGNYPDYDDIFNEDENVDYPIPPYEDIYWKDEKKNPILSNLKLSDKEAKAYADKYQDLKDAFGYDTEKLSYHYYNHGINENRTIDPELFERQNDLSMSDKNRFQETSNFDFIAPILTTSNTKIKTPAIIQIEPDFQEFETFTIAPFKTGGLKKIM